MTRMKSDYSFLSGDEIKKINDILKNMDDETCKSLALFGSDMYRKGIVKGGMVCLISLGMCIGCEKLIKAIRNYRKRKSIKN